MADAGADEHGSWVEAYAERIEAVSESMRPVDVIAATAGPDYARHIRDAEALGRANTDRLPEPVREELEAIGELLEALSISRQYYKTIHLHQGFGQLTRNLVYVGLPAALVAVYVPLVYESGGTTTVPPRHLPVVVGAAVVLAPLALLLVHLLRITSVMRYTVSVGQFTPPREWPWAE